MAERVRMRGLDDEGRRLVGVAGVLDVLEEDLDLEPAALFQPPAASSTHASGSFAVCPICGGRAADPGCWPHCHSDITTRTAGWLVTQVATTMYGAPKIGSHPGSAAASAGTRLQPH